MIPKKVLVLGQGVAAICVARLLISRGWHVELRGRPLSRSSPRIILNAITAKLLGELFEIQPYDASDIFAKHGAISIESRALAQANRKPIEVLPHHGISIAALDLAKTLRALLMVNPPFINEIQEGDLLLSEDDIAAFDWVVDARGKQASSEGRVLLGERRAITVDVELDGDTPHGRCWMETTPEGWLFLMPSGHGLGSLQVVVPNLSGNVFDVVKTLLASASLVSRFVTRQFNEPFILEAAPSISLSIGAKRFIRVGDAAVAFDPICGDGTGNAVRSAILATAVLEAVASGLTFEQGLGYYRWRLMQAFVHHIEYCESFYREAFSSAAWISELRKASEVRAGISSELSHAGKPRFRLKGLSLVNA